MSCSSEQITVSLTSIANATAIIDRMLTRLTSNISSSQLNQQSLTQDMYITALAALSTGLSDATASGSVSRNATLTLMGDLLSVLARLPVVYSDDLLTLPNAATATSAIAAIVTHASMLKLGDQYTALETLQLYVLSHNDQTRVALNGYRSAQYCICAL